MAEQVKLNDGFVVVHGTEESINVQQALFKIGCKWRSSDFEICEERIRILVFRKGRMTYLGIFDDRSSDTLKEEGLREYTPEEIINLVNEDQNTIVFDGKIYRAVRAVNDPTITNLCTSCAFRKYRSCYKFKCSPPERTDGRHVYFREDYSIPAREKVDKLDTKNQIVPLREEVYGRTTHAALMEAHRQREKNGKYNEFVRCHRGIIDKVVRKLTCTKESRTDESQEEME